MAHRPATNVYLRNGARPLLLLWVLWMLLAGSLQVSANVRDLDRFVEQQVARIQETSAGLGVGADLYPLLIEKLTERLAERVLARDPAIVEGVRNVISEQELQVHQVNQVHQVSEPQNLASAGLGLSMALAPADGASNPHLLLPNRTLSIEGRAKLQQRFNNYLLAHRPIQVMQDASALALYQEEHGDRTTGRSSTLLESSRVVVSLLKDVMDNLIGESDELSVPLLLVEQVPLLGRVLRKLRERHSERISTLIRAARYVVKIAHYLAHKEGVQLSDIKRDGMDLLKRNSRQYMKSIVDSLIRVDDSSSPARLRYNMLVRLTYYLFIQLIN